ncbi:MAG: prepilin-type N-terminal cleavage/methylation domain-containing protein [Simkaniaceae bacterium]|nr:prepilin-type N-terminal cleavage/methylation domain-containing protein [Simkaniaceae bacterium]
MKKKYAMTLLEIMIVIFIIGIIGSVIGYNMRGSLDKGKAFKTKEGVNKIYEIVQLEEAQGNVIDDGMELGQAVESLLVNSGMVRKPKDLLKDGWGNPYKFDRVGNEIHVTSNKYEKYCEAKGIKDLYPWKENGDSL